MDLARLELIGPGVPVLEDVSGPTQNGFAQLDFSETGTVVYVPGSAARGQTKLALVDLAGKIQVLPVAPGLFSAPTRTLLTGRAYSSG
jgi:hypothetical protein